MRSAPRRSRIPWRVVVLVLSAALCAAPARAADDPWAPPDLGAATVINARWESGVPLGGLGVGKVELYADGGFAKATTNHNWDRDTGFLRDAFFAVAAEGDPGWQGRLLRLFPDGEYGGVTKPQGTRYVGLFPRAWIDFSDTTFPLDARITAFSPLIADDVDDSALPLAFFRVRLTNHGLSAVKARVAFSWPNLIGYGGMRGISWNPLFGNKQEAVSAAPLEGLRFESTADRPGIEANVQGIHLTAVEPKNGDAVWRVGTWASGGDTIPWWDAFASGGQPSAPEPAPGLRRAGVMGIDVKVPPRGERDVDFELVWFMPQQVVQRRDENGQGYGPTEDLGHWFLNRFSSPEQIATFGSAQRDRLITDTAAWQQPILDSNLPDWLRAQLINSAFPAFANSVLTRDGRFTSLESPVYMDGALGTMDQRMAGHDFYARLFSSLDRRELDMFGAAQQDDGRIPHFIGNVHEAVGDPNVVYGLTDWPDLACSWISQVANTLRSTGDQGFASQQWPRVTKALDWLAKADHDGDTIPEGGSSFDYESLPPGSFAYTASAYLGTLRLAADLADAMGDSSRAKKLGDLFSKVQKAAQDELWTGGSLRKWSNRHGDQHLDASFAAALAGDWLARKGGASPVFPGDVIDAAVHDLLFRNLKPFSPVPPMEVAQDGSIPAEPTFLLQELPYLGAESIYADYVHDGLDVFHRAYQVQWQRNGDPWSASLVYDSPGGAKGPLTSYISAPGAWSVLAALTGISIDRTRGVLYVSPRFGDELPELHAPLFLPGTWLWIDAVPAQRSLSLRVLRNTGAAPPPTVSAVARDGTSSPIALPSPWTLTEGSSLTLDSSWDALTVATGKVVDGAGPGGSPVEPDGDGDGVPDSVDNCPTVSNADQADSDGNGIGDACDTQQPADSDHDGVPNGRDNCPLIFNPFQTDTDGDGQGDACDQTDDRDSDGDGVPNSSDNCPDVANSDQADRDGNGIGDACEPASAKSASAGGGCSVTDSGGGESPAAAIEVLAAVLALTVLLDRTGDATAKIIKNQSCTGLVNTGAVQTATIAGTLGLAGNTLTVDVNGQVSGSYLGAPYTGTYDGVWTGTQR